MRLPAGGRLRSNLNEREHSVDTNSTNIYDFAYRQGRKVIAPKRHWRRAIDVQETTRTLQAEFAQPVFPPLPEGIKE